MGADFYVFVPYNYGPFDRDIHIDASKLSEQGLISIVEKSSGFKQYLPTLLGLQRASLLEDGAPARAVEYLTQVVHWAQQISFSALVRAIYAKYPDYRQNSVFQG